MPVSIRHFRLFTRLLGGVFTLMGLGLLAVFELFLATGANPLPTVEVDALGLLVLASVGAFALPLGVSLLAQRTPAVGPLRIGAYSLGLMAVLRLAAMASPEIREAAGLVPLVEFFVLGAMAAVGLWLRPEGQAPIEIRTVVDIDAPASEAWHVLGERFGEVATFARGLRASGLSGPVGVGAVRSCETKPFGPFAAASLTEELVEYSPETMRFAYVAGGELPAFIPASTNRWAIHAVGPARSQAVSEVSIELSWWAVPFAPLLAWSIGGEVRRFGEDLAHRVETGSNPVDAAA